MNRLTKRIPNGTAVMDCDSCGLKTSRECTFYECRGQLIRCLAEYEDTGLTPEEIKAPFTGNTVLNLAAHVLGVEPSRLQELAEADKDGRVIILPYKVGDTVYYIGGGGFGDIVVEGTVTDICGLPDRAVKVRPAGMGFSIGLDADHLFRTYAAAEKSIGGK